MEEDIYRQIASLREIGQGAVLATIISKKGSAPREIGAKMLVRADGTASGSISGGCVEAETWQEAMRLMKGGTGNSKLLSFHLTEKEALESGLICGGVVKIHLERVSPPPTLDVDVYREILLLLSQGGEGILVTLLDKEGRCPIGGEGKLLFRQEGPPIGVLGGEPSLEEETIKVIREGGGVEIARMVSLMEGWQAFLEPVSASPTAFIFGGGHISLPLSRMAKMAGFRVVVIDDRETFANSTRFPEADEVLAREFFEVFPCLSIHRSSYIIIVTRGHSHDEMVLEWAVGQPACYVGMIGSRQKIRKLYANLAARGISQEALGRVHSPIGLPIHAETPEEIAVSILAEMIQTRRERKQN